MYFLGYKTFLDNNPQGNSTYTKAGSGYRGERREEVNDAVNFILDPQSENSS